MDDGGFVVSESYTESARLIGSQGVVGRDVDRGTWIE